MNESIRALDIMTELRQQGRPLIIAGPCSAESEEQVMRTAVSLADRGVSFFRAGLWKPRTAPGSFEGVGAKGLAWLRRVKEETGMSVATEVAKPSHVKEVLDAGVDLVWIGARTVTDPFAMQELADAMRDCEVPVLVKNPVSPDLELWCGAVQRLRNAGVRQIGVIHRGFSRYGKGVYRNDPIWQIPFEMRRRYPEMTILCDPSHICGRKDLVGHLSRQAMNLDFDGLVIEVHCNPDAALSDRNQQILPEELNELVSGLKLKERKETAGKIDVLRERIDEIDDQIITLLSKRMEVSREIGRYKVENDMPVLQPGRYGDLLADRREKGVSMGLDGDFVEKIIKSVHEESVKQQI